MLKILKYLFKNLSSPSPPVDIFSIGKDIWIQILLSLEIKDIISFSFTCKEFNNFSNDKRLWRQVFNSIPQRKLVDLEKILLKEIDYKKLTLGHHFYEIDKESVFVILKNLRWNKEVKKKINEYEERYKGMECISRERDNYEDYRKVYKVLFLYPQKRGADVSGKNEKGDLLIFPLDIFTNLYVFKKQMGKDLIFHLWGVKVIVLIIDSSDPESVIGFNVDELLKHEEISSMRIFLIFNGIENERIRKILNVFKVNGSILFDYKIFNDFNMEDIKNSISFFMKKVRMFENVKYSEEIRELWSLISIKREGDMETIFMNWIPKKLILEKDLNIGFSLISNIKGCFFVK